MLILLIAAFVGQVIANGQVRQQERLILAMLKTSDNFLTVDAIEAVNDRIALTRTHYGKETEYSAELGAGIERTTISRIMLTYEVSQNRSINALQSRYDVNLIGTNHSYPHVFNLTIIHGRFFGQDALTQAQRVAVLNERAAFEMFGNIYAAGSELNINNRPYRVAGVISDGDEENLNVYVPVTLLENNITIDALAANFSINQDLSAEYILTVWQQMGITADRYNIVNFDVLSIVVRDRLILSVFLILAVLLIGGILKIIKAAKKEWHVICNLKREIYMAELLKTSVVKRLIGIVVSIIAMAAVIAALSLNAFNRVLIMYDARGMLADVRAESFAVQMAEMAQWYSLSHLFFWGFGLTFLIFVYIVYAR